MKLPIDLGKKMSKPTPMVHPEPDEDDLMYYPSLYLEWDDKYDLPASGKMMVCFNKRAQTDRTDSDGETRQTVELDITSIESVKADKEDKSDKRGDMMDKYRDEVMGEE